MTFATNIGPGITPGLSSQPSGQDTSEQGGQEGPRTSDSTVGYIDNAIPSNMFRLRYDSAYKNNSPTRGEFFYARTGTGLPLEETRVDYQDVSLYAEHRFGDRFSAFIEVPYRMANFEINENHSGVGDMNAGFKYAWLSTDCTVLSTQFRVYVPTGNEHLGLGNGHTGVEPALLLYHKWTDRLASESELRYWQAIGGTAHVQGALVRYGTGLRYDLFKTCKLTVSPVVELVGWTFVDGEKDQTPALDDVLPMLNAAGDTILNAKTGVRFKFGSSSDFYVGYGRALTGTVWYKDIMRFEFRLNF